ncbi:YbbR domain-containing protein [Eubacterium ruminantium]|nr:YbbR domain-containing protein [Eubacterium ruminantium]
MKSSKKQGIIKTLFLRILSLAIAFLIWLLVVNVDDYKIVKEISNIPVEQLNGESIEESGLVYDVTSGETVDIIVEGRRSVVDKLNKSDFTATADLAKISFTNTVKINVQLKNKNAEGDITIDVVDDAMILSIEEKKSKQFEVRVDTKGELPEGYALGTPVCSPAVINVEGPQSLINKVRYVRVAVDINGITSDYETEVKAAVYDGNDEVMASSRIVTDHSAVNVKIPVYRTKVVPIKYFTIGNVASGFKMTGVSGSISEIMITGPEDMLNKTSFIAVNDIDISGINEQTVYERSVSNFLPENIYLADSVDSLQVTVDVEELVVKTFTVNVSDIKLANTKTDMYQYKVAIQGAYVISVTGLEADVSGVALDDLNPTIDCGGLEEGTNVVTVRLQKNNKLDITENGTVTVVVTEKTTETLSVTPEDEGN